MAVYYSVHAVGGGGGGVAGEWRGVAAAGAGRVSAASTPVRNAMRCPGLFGIGGMEG